MGLSNGRRQGGAHNPPPNRQDRAAASTAPCRLIKDRDDHRDDKVCTGPSRSHTAADTPESLRSCLGCLGDTGPRGSTCALPFPFPHTVAEAPEPPQSCRGRLGDTDAPWGNKVCTGPSHSHTAAVTPESLRPCLGRLGDRDALWEYEETHGPSTPTQRRIHRSPSGRAWAAWGTRTPRGSTRRHKTHPLAHNGGYTRVPRVVPGLLGDRDAPWEYEETQRPSTPKSLRSCLGCLGDRGAPWEYKETQDQFTPAQQRIHPSPSDPAWVAWRMETPRGVTRYAQGSATPTQRRLHPSASAFAWAVWGIRTP